VLGNTVINDRIDRFENAEKKMEFHISGFFYVADGKIKEWQDYTWPKVD
jgi:limonene-1,2-epoxide hydrolase